MKYESAYIGQTGKMIEHLKGKEDPIVKDYLLTCHKFIGELRNLDVIQIYTDLEYERAFNQVLELVEETYRPNQFVSVCSDAIIQTLDYEFIVYILQVKKQLKKPLKWIQLCELQYNFGIAEIKFKIKTNFTEDFTIFAIKSIKLKELWNLKS